MKKIKILAFTVFLSVNTFSQSIKMDTVVFENTTLLFDRYKPFGKNCENKNGIPKHCEKKEMLLDNNIDYLLEEQINTLAYLNIQYEIIDEEKLKKDIYKDSTIYRYFIKSVPLVSQRGNSCFSNPGALIFEYTLVDRLLKTSTPIFIDYAFYICDLQILVNDINRSIKKALKNK